MANLLDEVADLLGDLLKPDGDDNINDDLDVSAGVRREIFYTIPGL